MSDSESLPSVEAVRRAAAQLRGGDFVPESDAEADAFLAQEAAASTLSPRHEYVALLMANGWSVREIAKAAHYSESRCSIITRFPALRVRADQLRRRIQNKLDPARKSDEDLQEFESDAKKVIKDILTNGNAKPSVMANTAFKLLERTRGAPKQTVEHNAAGLADVLQALAQEQQAQLTKEPPAIEVESEVRNEGDAR